MVPSLEILPLHALFRPKTSVRIVKTGVSEVQDYLFYSKEKKLKNNKNSLLNTQLITLVLLN